MLDFAREMDASIAVSIDKAVAILTMWLRRFIDGIADEGLKCEGARRLGVAPEDVDEENPSSS